MPGFAFSVAVSPEGAVRLEGNVPNAGLGRYLGVKAGTGPDTDLTVAPGAPDGFVMMSVTAVETLRAIGEGSITVADGVWAVSAEAQTDDDLKMIMSRLDQAFDLEGWAVDVTLVPFNFAADYERNSQMRMSGAVPHPSLRAYLAVIGGGADVEALRIASNAPEGFGPLAIEGVRQLQRLESGSLTYHDDRWTLSGETLSPEVGELIRTALAPFQTDATIDMVFRQADLFGICADAVSAFSDSHTILFAPASAQLAELSRLELQDLAVELAKCPEAALHVEGHTDADGPADANMALSVSRAEAVVAELIALGIDFRRLYAIGYGETLPIASNDTRDGKAQNRRIVFSLVRE